MPSKIEAGLQRAEQTCKPHIYRSKGTWQVAPYFEYEGQDWNRYRLNRRAVLWAYLDNMHSAGMADEIDFRFVVRMKLND